MTLKMQAAVALHTVSAGIMVFGLKGLQKLPVDDWIRKQTGGYFQFLTIQGWADSFE
jgi:hypothetical protein